MDYKIIDKIAGVPNLHYQTHTSGSRQRCKGLCECQFGSINFHKRPTYSNGDLYCRNCEIAISEEEYQMLPILNKTYKCCFCCHLRLSRRARPKSNNIKSTISYKDLGISGVKKNSANCGHKKEVLK